ncbi:MAG TPA: NUDIX domain-containing protein [Candidatus Saccharimonadales bacterium]|nr:NUDIX domain-containing protein [Candidatus Saccharimonadales bacterium]
MSHIHTAPHQYDFTASAYIVRLDGPAPQLILHRHKKLNQYLQFGGHVELDESPWSAVVHEIAEESGYAMNQLKILQPQTGLQAISSGIIHPQPVATLSIRFGDTDHYHTDIAYAFVTREAPAGVVSDDELSDIKLCTAAELAALPAGQIPENVREAGLFILDECLQHWTEVDCATFQTSNPVA